MIGLRGTPNSETGDNREAGRYTNSETGAREACMRLIAPLITLREAYTGCNTSPTPLRGIYRVIHLPTTLLREAYTGLYPSHTPSGRHIQGYSSSYTPSGRHIQVYSLLIHSSGRHIPRFTP